MLEENIELEEFFDEEDKEIDEDDYQKYNNFRHKKIRHPKISLSSNKINYVKKEKIKENKKNKEENRKKNLNKLSQFENLILEILKKIKWLRENKMIYQIIIIYIIAFFFFIIIIMIFFKDKYMKKSFDFFRLNNYYSFVETDVINAQNNLKRQIDSKNSLNLMSIVDEKLLFMEIYTRELSSHNLILKDAFKNISQYNMNEDYEKEFGESFRITSPLNDLVNEDKNDIYNIKNLIVYYYNLVPIIHQNLEFFGIKMINFYFIGNDNKCGQGSEAINNLYFKYPLEGNNIGIDFFPTNNKINDYIIDPFIDCNNGYTIESDLLELIKKNNWYYNIIKENKDLEINFRMLKLMNINQQNIRKDYYMAYNKFNYKGYKQNNNEEFNINFMFALRLSKSDFILPFIKLDKYNDTLNYDYFSMFNFDNDDRINKVNLSKLKSNENSIYNYEYNIDESNSLILKNFKFMENMNFFGIYEKRKDLSSTRILKDNEKNILSLDNSIMIKYKELKNIQNNYNINIYYDADVLFYNLVYFLNQFILYKEKHPKYLTQNDAEVKNDSSNNISNDDHPCSISNIDEYYYKIKEKFNYDCVYDYCFFHSCKQLDDLNINLNNFHRPNCYCMPLFCKDEKTQKNSEFEKIIKKKLNIKDNAQFDYSYTSDYSYYLSELENIFTKIGSFFNRTNFNMICEIFFNKKNPSENKTFITNIMHKNYMKKGKEKMVTIFIYNKEKMENIIAELHQSTLNILFIFIIIYIAAFLILGIFIFFNIYISCNKLILRMNILKDIRRTIISNSKDLNNKSNNIEKREELDNSINNKYNLIDEVKLSQNNYYIMSRDENDNLINEKEKLNKIRKIQKGIDDTQDELDELIKLIEDNLSTFKIQFNLEQELNESINTMKKQYNEIIKVNKYSTKLFLREEKEKIIFDNENNISMDSRSGLINNKKNMKFDDISVNIICELLSLSNHKFDFSNIKTNFYFKNNSDNSVYGLSHIVSNIAESNSNDNNEIINIDKLKNALDHYFENIHLYWKKTYEIQKSKDEI